MPSIELQQDKVIAYLDSIENVIGCKTGDDIIYGNDEDNYLSGMGGVDLLYGQAGNDTLILQEGYAEGGEGHDNYLILRASLEERYSVLFQTIINEMSHSEASLVRLNYTFDEIAAIHRRGKDITFDLKVNDGNKDNQLIYHLVTLRNVYADGDTPSFAHRYTVVTMDGFMLTPADNKDKNNNVLYHFSYLDKYNNQKKIKQLSINDKNHSLSVSYSDTNNNINLLPELQYSGFSSGDNLVFKIEGNSQNNHYLGITANSSIKLTAGYDNYQISSFLAKDKNEKITISLTDNHEQLTSTCTSHFFLSDVSGFDLMFSDGILSHRYNPDGHVKLVFDTASLKTIFDAGMSIKLIDKDNRVFHLPKQDTPQGLLSPSTTLDITLSEQNDIVMLPSSLRLNKETLSAYSISSPRIPSILILSLLPHNISPQTMQAIDLLPIIELMGGDDFVVNHNQSSSVIDGGKGDDHIVVNEGHHILIAGEGNDKLYGGNGHDLFISTSGNDYLSGGSGNNVYMVQKRHGEVTVYDEGEMSHIFVSGLSEHEKLIFSQVGEDWQYRTTDNQFILTVKTKGASKTGNSTVQVIEKQHILSPQSLAAIIQQMAIFNQQQLATMQGSEVIPSSAWSPLAMVVEHL
ncbi:calcium-binding protein [Proteus mirabilis]|nr:calcium-binding protein [Proteus mirabilis]